MKRDKISTINFSLYILLSFYVFGGGMVDSLVVFPTWRYVGPAEFPVFHQHDNARIIPVFVIFFFLSFIPQILLYWFRPSVIKKWMVTLALILNAIMLISSISIQIPIQLKLDQEYSRELIERLISTDLQYRVSALLLLALVNFSMLYKVIKRAAYENEATKA